MSLIALAPSADVGGVGSPPRWVAQAHGNPYAIRKVASGRFLFEVRENDRWPGDGAKPLNRSEYQSRVKHRRGEDVWFSYQMRLLSPQPSKASFCILGQFHQTSDPWDGRASPPFAVNLFPKSNTLRFIKRYTADRQTTATVDEVMYESKPIVSGQWVHIVGHIVFDWENNGLVELWLDGRKVVDLPRTSIGYNDVLGPYWKFGIYRAQTSEDLTVEYANVELGATPLWGRVYRPLSIPG